MPYEISDYLVVVPSIRPIRPDYLQAFMDFDIFICDDSDGKVDRKYITKKDYRGDGYRNIILGDNDFREKLIGDKKDLFARHCPSVKSLGLYYGAHRYKAIILIDDDVDTQLVSPLSFMRIGREIDAVEFYSNSGWFNTMTLLHTKAKSIYARGYPYEYRGESTIFENVRKATPYFNQGLWLGTPDINGIDKFEMDREFSLKYALGYVENNDPPWHVTSGDLVNNIVLGKKQKLPLSIMNCQIDTSLIPAFWQPPDYPIYNTFKIRRHDDVWSMYFLKKVMDLLNLDVTVGHPVAWHRKEGDPVGEILSEHYTNLIQNSITGVLDAAYNYVRMTPDMTAARVAERLAEECLLICYQFGSGIFKYVLKYYFTGCKNWARMFL